MRVNLSTFCEIHTPIYVLEEERLRRNLSLIKSVAERADVEIILAFKAYALWKTFPIFREYIHSTTASSLSEAKLAFEKFGSPAHTFSPAYTDYEIDEIARCSSHLSFNSLSQYERYHERARLVNPEIITCPSRRMTASSLRMTCERMSVAGMYSRVSLHA